MLISGYINPKDVIVKERFRKDLGDLSNLKESVKRLGYLHPIGLNSNNELVYGMRRLAVALELKLEQIPYVRIELNPNLEKVAEIHENLCRKDMNWVDEVKAKAELDKLCRVLFGEQKAGRPTENNRSESEQLWDYRKTADFIGEATTVTFEDIQLANALELHSELSKLPNKSSAIRVLRNLMEKEKRVTLEKETQTIYGKLYHGDCHAILPTLQQKFDFILLDPPYFDTKDAYTWSADSWKSADWSVPNYELLVPIFAKLLTSEGVVALFGHQPRLAELYEQWVSNFDFWFEIVWIKKETSMLVNWHRPLPAHEDIWFFKKKDSSIENTHLCIRHMFEKKICDARFSWGEEGYHAIRGKYKGDAAVSLDYPRSYFIANNVHGGSKEYYGHPTQKPLPLIEFLIELCTLPNDWVLDPFLGAATTAVVCEKRKRNWVGIELEPRYIQIAKQRLSKEVVA